MKQSCNHLPSFFCSHQTGYPLMENTVLLGARKEKLNQLIQEFSQLNWRFAGNLRQLNTNQEIAVAELIYHQLLHIESIIEFLRHEILAWQQQENDNWIFGITDRSLEQWDIVAQKLEKRLITIRENKGYFLFLNH